MWTKAIGQDLYHLYQENTELPETLCGRHPMLDGREEKKENPENICSECQQLIFAD